MLEADLCSASLQLGLANLGLFVPFLKAAATERPGNGILDLFYHIPNSDTGATSHISSSAHRPCRLGIFTTFYFTRIALGAIAGGGSLHTKRTLDK